MQSVGTRLREARVQRGLSLDDINARTRINSKNLSAIESDEVHELSSPFFYRSFVRQYADTVGLDFQILSSAVDSLAGHMRQPDLPGQGEHQIVRVAPIQARAKRDWSWVLPATIFIGLIILGSGGFAYLKFFSVSGLQKSVVSSIFLRQVQDSRPTQVPRKLPEAAASPAPTQAVPPATAAAALAPAPKPQQTAAALAENGEPSGATESGATASASSLAPEDDSARSGSDKIRLELEATERTWLSVSADGKPAYTGILEPLETKVLEGQDSARVRTGNAGGVSIIFNGRDIGVIGPRGTTRTVVFSKTGYAIEPADRPTLSRSSRIGG